MAQAVLQDRQRIMLQEERQIANELQRCLEGFEEANAYATTLQQVMASLGDLFLLVVVGEFNAGKSACINALLHNEVLEEGVIPTTQQVTILRYGSEERKLQREQGVLEVSYPADFLHDISVVDTPGVNAVLLEHQRLTEEFVPRSDLILFITSADRPFTQSERTFLERIRNWGKKVIIILNKIDLFRRPAELQQVLTFVRDNCKQLLGFEPDIFPVSAMQAQRSRDAKGHQAVELWNQSRFGALEEYLFTTLDEAERVRLKLLNPLGVLQRVLTETRGMVEQRAKLLAEDARTVTTIDEQLKFYYEDMQRSFRHRLTEMENIVLEMRGRGDRFFDDTIRLGRVLDLAQGDRIRAEFEQEVLGNSAQRIEQAVQELIDWVVEQEHRLWQNITEYLDRRKQVSLRSDNQMVGSIGKQFDYNRRTLLQSVARTASTALQTYDAQAETARLSQDLRASVAQAAAIGAGGIGLGAFLIAAVGTAAADVTGILAGLVFLGLGVYIIPARRRRAKQTFREQMDALRNHLHMMMEEQFRKELNQSVSKVQESLAPYTRFVRAEQQKTATMQAQVADLGKKVQALRGQIEAL